MDQKFASAKLRITALETPGHTPKAFAWLLPMKKSPVTRGRS